MNNRILSEITIGEQARITRKLTEKEIDLFAIVSGDLNPTHFDQDYDQPAHDDGRVVGHSMWAGALFSGLLGSLLPGSGTTYKRQQFDFYHPPHVGDTVTAIITVTEKLLEQGTVVFDCKATTENNTVVVQGTAEVYAPTEHIHNSDAIPPDANVSRHDGYAQLMAGCKGLSAVVTAVAHPCDELSLRGAVEAAEAGLITPVFIAPEQRLRDIAAKAGLDISHYRHVDAAHSHDAANKAVALIRAGDAAMLMKGSLHTDELLSAVVASKTGLRTERRISHVFVMDVPTYPGLLLVTDAAVNIFPDLLTKRDICQNAIELAHSLGIAEPRVAILSAVETVTPTIPSTIDAAALCKMADRGQITGGIVDGPLAMDNAISPIAARQKGIESPVAGRAHILLAPDLEAANILAKQLTFLAQADASGVVLGARVPIVLTSRADNIHTRMASCAVAMRHAHRLTTGITPS